MAGAGLVIPTQPAHTPKGTSPVPWSDAEHELRARSTDGFDAAAVAWPQCARCHGTGAVPRHNTVGVVVHWNTCSCVYRHVFRHCLAKYRYCQATMAGCGATRIERVGRIQGKCGIITSFRRAEYSADFLLAARRALAARDTTIVVFEVYFLEGGGWSSAMCRVNSRIKPDQAFDRGRFFHAVYRCEELVGRELSQCRPYSLYPTSNYFSCFDIPLTSLTQSRTSATK